MESSGKNTVLLVDDEKSNLEVLISILSPEYTLYMTKNASVALEMAEKYLPDIILLDVLMPDISGFEVLSALKASDKARGIPVIFISGLDGEDDRKKGLDLGAVDFIPKPFNAETVQSKVRHYIQSR
jgi:putative two-component system response regulator